MKSADTSALNVITHKQDLLNCFKVLDKEGTSCIYIIGLGCVKLYDLKHVLTTVGEKMNPDDVDTLFKILGYSNFDLAVPYEGYFSFPIL